MFDKQSDFTNSLTRDLYHEFGGTWNTMIRIELIITRWLLDNDVRFRNAGITTGTTTPTEQQSQK